MLPFGVYDCYIPGGLYFCKPIEYAKQCPFQTSNVLPDECKRRKLGEAGQYYFIGDLLSGWIIHPMQQGQQQQQQQQPQHQFPQQQRQPTSYGKAEKKTFLPRGGRNHINPLLKDLYFLSSEERKYSTIAFRTFLPQSLQGSL